MFRPKLNGVRDCIQKIGRKLERKYGSGKVDILQSYLAKNIEQGLSPLEAVRKAYRQTLKDIKKEKILTKEKNER